ncbi:MAG: Hsp20/alpha crystallin family protein [Spirochaetales bacterium]|nr:Hsp20/alpha crystallin family protein [Spirochaetales bacterium]
MKDNFIFDLNGIMEEVFEAAEHFKDAFSEGFNCKPGNCKTHFHWDENVDYYPAYLYPPANVYITAEKELVFEFALSGFDEKGIDLQFKGDYMILTVKVPEDYTQPEGVRYFKRRLKLKNIVDQKYYVPQSKFERDKVSAVFKNGLLRIVVPPKEDYTTDEAIKVNITKEGK